MDSGVRDLDFTRLDADAFGSWTALHTVEHDTETDNVLPGDVLTEDARDSYTRSEGRLVVAIGLEGCIVVDRCHSAGADRGADRRLSG